MHVSALERYVIKEPKRCTGHQRQNSYKHQVALLFCRFVFVRRNIHGVPAPLTPERGKEGLILFLLRSIRELLRLEEFPCIPSQVRMCTSQNTCNELMLTVANSTLLTNWPIHSTLLTGYKLAY